MNNNEEASPHSCLFVFTLPGFCKNFGIFTNLTRIKNYFEFLLPIIKPINKPKIPAIAKPICGFSFTVETT